MQCHIMWIQSVGLEPFFSIVQIYMNICTSLLWKQHIVGTIIVITQGTFLNIIDTSKLYKGLLENLKVLMPHMNVWLLSTWWVMVESA
jgi:hypothetical protein